MDQLELQLGHSLSVSYRLEIDDFSKLNLRRYQCDMPTTTFEETQHRQAITTKCLTKCMDKHYYQDKLNCTSFKKIDTGFEVPYCINIFPNIYSDEIE